MNRLFSATMQKRLKYPLLCGLLLQLALVALAGCGGGEGEGEGDELRVMLDRNGGWGGTAEIAASLHDGPPVALEAPMRCGYRFLGYFSQREGGRQYYGADMHPLAPWWRGGKERPLYAHWEKETIVDPVAQGLFSTNMVFPGAEWETAAPADEGINADVLPELERLVAGNGVLVRHGRIVFAWGQPDQREDIHSACKPIYSMLLLVAVQKGLVAGVDAKVADSFPELGKINSGRDADITWRQLACMTSGYATPDPPGTRWSYNDLGISLYAKTLATQVFGSEKMRTPFEQEIFGPLGMQDEPFCVEEQTGTQHTGRIKISARDFARFGLLTMAGGRWAGRQLVREDLLVEMVTSQVPVTMHRSSYFSQKAWLVEGGESFGGSNNLDADGQGIYSFNWWINSGKPNGEQYLPGLPGYTYMANGLEFQDACLVIPEWDVVMAWTGSHLSEWRHKERFIATLRACLGLPFEPLE